MTNATSPHHVFSREIIDREPILPIDPSLIPWAKRDVADTLDVDVPKAEKGLRKAEEELATARKQLAKTTFGTNEHTLAAKTVEFTESMCSVNRCKLEFYAGKVYLLGKRIAASKA